MEVLARLGFLASEVGDEDTARKWHRKVARPQTRSDRSWMNATVLKLIQRMGEYSADPNAPLRPNYDGGPAAALRASTTMSIRLVLLALAIGIAVSAWIVRAGGPSERLTATWAFGFRSLIIAVIAAEIITRLLRRKQR